MTGNVRWMVCVLSLATSACGDASLGPVSSEKEPFSSNQATLLNFELSATYEVANAGAARGLLLDQQLLYTVGQLNAHRAVSRLDRLEVRALRPVTPTEVSYKVVLPVAWAAPGASPARHGLVLPRRVDPASLAAFAARYAPSCVETRDVSVDAGSFWYYFRPHAPGCVLDDEDVVRTTATVSVSQENSTGKYPEYDRVWEDGRLTVLALFGTYAKGAIDAEDPGVAAYAEFVRRVGHVLGADALYVPNVVPGVLDARVPEVTISAGRPRERQVSVTALLVDDVRAPETTVMRRYAELSAMADVIIYNGHSDFGASVRALAQAGTVVTGNYQIFFVNGCDSFAYVDRALGARRALANSDDPQGTKYLDVVTNVLPAFFHSMPGASLALVSGLLDTQAPKTYAALFAGVDEAQVVVVSGEEDNTFAPGVEIAVSQPWEGLFAADAVHEAQGKSYATPVLPAGSYVFALSAQASHAGGDADLYVRAGAPASVELWDCRPFEPSSEEECTLHLAAPSAVHVFVHGYAPGLSYFALRGAPR